MTFGPLDTLDSVLQSVLELRSYQFEGAKDVLSIRAPGDWILRPEASETQRLQALQEILRREVGRDIRCELQQLEREVIVAKGTYELHRDPRARRANDVYMYSDVFDANDGAGGGSGSWDKFLQTLGSRIGRRVLDETAGPKPGALAWAHHRSSDLSRDPEGSARSTKLDLLLANLSRQTSVTFTRERRTVPVWVITEGR